MTIQSQMLKPDVAIKAPKLDWKPVLVAGAVVAASVTLLSTSSLASLLMRQNVENAKTSRSGWIIRAGKQLSHAVFNDLAQSNPKHLLRLVREDNLEPPLLTFAAESLGQITEEAVKTEVVKILLSLTQHLSPLVREGAVYGLSSFLNEEPVKNRLSEMLLKDVSSGVRLAVEDVL